MDDRKWYVIKVTSGKERKIKEYIEKLLNNENLSSYVSNIVLPVEKMRYMSRGKPVVKDRSFLPGYILIQADLNGDVQHLITGVNGVMNFVGSGGNPEAMKNSEVKDILERIDINTDINSNNGPNYIVGESVKIIDGPFANFLGNVEEVSEDKKRVKVNVKIFGRLTPLDLLIEQIIKEY